MKNASAAMLLSLGLVALTTSVRAGEAEPKPASVSWKDGRTTLELGSAEISMSNRIQIRFTDSDPQNGDPVGTFRLRRARTSLDGWLYRNTLQFELMVDWVDTPLLEDLALNWDVSGRKTVQLKLGQFKVPFGRQELTSDTAQQFVDRSIVASEFQKGRDQGLQLWGVVARKKLEYRVGVFNGGGRGSVANDDRAFQYDARLLYQPFGDARYSEGDLDVSPRPLLALAVNLERNDARRGGTQPAAGVKRSLAGADVSFKFRGFSATAEVFDRTLTPAAAADYKSNGYHAQAGYFVKPGGFEVALRWASWDPNGRVPGDGKSERGIALNYLYKKHVMKVQADFRQLEDRAKKVRDHELRAQVQFIF